MGSGPSTGQRLLRDHAYYIDRTKGCFDSGEGNHKADHGAVAITDEEALVDLVVVPLTWNDLKVV